MRENTCVYLHPLFSWAKRSRQNYAPHNIHFSISELTSLDFVSKKISGQYKVEDIPATYTGEYVIKITVDSKKAESDALPLFIIGKL